ncbi:MAG: hypothetical protein MK033_10425 [Candidatus Caenarcaniphilales bacterium]|nr:hypothetical protein [Candidatus Caenarcaniphilales bacterium]
MVSVAAQNANNFSPLRTSPQSGANGVVKFKRNAQVDSGSREKFEKLFKASNFSSAEINNFTPGRVTNAAFLKRSLGLPKSTAEVLQVLKSIKPETLEQLDQDSKRLLAKLHHQMIARFDHAKSVVKEVSQLKSAKAPKQDPETVKENFIKDFTAYLKDLLDTSENGLISRIQRSFNAMVPQEIKDLGVQLHEESESRKSNAFD